MLLCVFGCKDRNICTSTLYITDNNGKVEVVRFQKVYDGTRYYLTNSCVRITDSRPQSSAIRCNVSNFSYKVVCPENTK